MAETFSLFVGIDWGSQSHQVHIIDPAGTTVREFSVEHSATALAQLADSLISLGGDPVSVAIAIEVPRGPVVEALLERGFTMFACNPRQLDRFRDRHTMAGAKDDRLDAFVLADALRSDRHKLRRISLDDPLIIQLRELTRLEGRLATEIRRQANRLRDQLFRYFPQPLTLCPGADEPWLWALLELAPTAGRAAQLRHSRIERLLQQHRIRRFTADQLREKLREPALKVAAGVVEAASTHIAVLLPMLRLANEQRQRVERRIADLLEQMTAPNKDDTGQHSDAAVLLSLPGVGRVVAATMLAEAWQALAERDGARLRAEMGVAPITKRSGKTMLHLMRRACNQRLRQAAYFWSANAMANDQEIRAKYAAKRARGQGHARALRSLADGLIRILMAMLREGTLYDPHRRARSAPCSPVREKTGTREAVMLG